MNAKTEKSLAGFKLIQYAFKLAGLNAMDIQQCKKLSHYITEKTGQNVSAITIFRMAQPEKYQLKPYPTTLQILLDYCNLNSLEDIPEIIRPTQPKVLFSFGDEDRADALDTLINCLLETGNKNIIFNFLDRLPDKYSNAGDQQIILSHCFANYFRSQNARLKAANMFTELNHHPHFQTHFTMAFPDMDFVDGYFFDGLEGYLKKCDIEMFLSSLNKKQESYDPHTLENNIYHYTLYIWMAFVKNYFTGLKQMGEVLYEKENKNPSWLSELSHIPVLLTRYFTAKILYYHTLGKSNKIKESVFQLMASLQENIRSDASNYDKIFSITMACDALLLIEHPLDCMSDFLQIQTLKEAAKAEIEPAQTRFLMYANQDVNPFIVDSGLKNTYIYGYYELNFSNQLQSMYTTSRLKR